MDRSSIEEEIKNQRKMDMWVPHPTILNVFTHKHSRKEVERHEVTVSREDYGREIGFVQGRISNKHPFIRSLYFYIEEGRNDKSTWKVSVFGDRVVPLLRRDWTF